MSDLNKDDTVAGEGVGSSIAAVAESGRATEEKPPKGTPCSSTVFQNWRDYPCSNKACVIRDGKPFCASHDPTRLQGRQAARNARRQWESTLRDLHAKRGRLAGQIMDAAVSFEEGTASGAVINEAVGRWKQAMKDIEEHERKAPAK